MRFDAGLRLPDSNVPVGSARKGEHSHRRRDPAKGPTEGEIPILIEAKSTGDFTNTNKRRKRGSDEDPALRKSGSFVIESRPCLLSRDAKRPADLTSGEPRVSDNEACDVIGVTIHHLSTTGSPDHVAVSQTLHRLTQMLTTGQEDSLRIAYAFACNLPKTPAP